MTWQPIETAREEWKPVYGYEGSYEVSSLGQVRSIERRVTRKDGHHQTHGGKILKQTIGTHGYPSVALCNGGKSGKTRTVHSIVAEAFIGKRPAGHETRHKNGIRSDARFENIEYCTNKVNKNDRIAHGTHNFGERNPAAKLTNKDVFKIRSMAKTEKPKREIAKEFGVSIWTVDGILKRKRWRLDAHSV